MLAAATLLLINVPAGTALTALPGGVWFNDAGRNVSVQVIGLEDAALAIDAARRRAEADPALSVEDGVALGYATVTVSRGSAERRLYLSFGEEHLLITEGVAPEARAETGAEAGDAMPGAAPGTPPETPADGPRARLRPGSEAGRHPGRVDLLIDGYLLGDAGGALPLDFFTGPLVLEIWPEGAAVPD